LNFNSHANVHLWFYLLIKYDAIAHFAAFTFILVHILLLVPVI
jgi:hypothetical protein